MLFSLPFSVFHVSPESIIELSERWACHQVRKLGFMLRVWNRGPGTRTGTQYAWRRRKSYQGHYHRGHMSSSLLQHCSMDANPKDPLPVAPPLPSTTHVQIQGPHSWYEESKEWSQHVLVGCRERDIPLLWKLAPVISYIFPSWFSFTVFTGSIYSKYLPSVFHKHNWGHFFKHSNTL